jgi:hypothetical protein
MILTTVKRKEGYCSSYSNPVEHFKQNTKIQFLCWQQDMIISMTRVSRKLSTSKTHDLAELATLQSANKRSTPTEGDIQTSLRDLRYATIGHGQERNNRGSVLGAKDVLAQKTLTL